MPGWTNAAAKAVGIILSFALLMVLARSMAPPAFAQVAVTLAWVGLGTALVGFSLPLAVVRLVPEAVGAGRADRAAGMLRFAVGFTLAAMVPVVAIAIGASVSSALAPTLGPIVRIGAALLVLNALLQLACGVMQSLHRVTTAELAANVLRPLAMLAALGVLFRGIGQPPYAAPFVLEVYVGATVAAFALCAFVAWGTLPPAVRSATPTYEIGRWWRTALGLHGVLLVSALAERVDVIVMALVAGPDDVATYALATRFAQAILLTFNAVAAVLAPRLAEHLSSDAPHGERVSALVRAATTQAFVLAAAATLGVLVAGPYVLRVFGAHYASAYAPLLILCCGLAIAAAFGPGILVLSFAGAARVGATCLAVGVVVNALLTVLLAPRFGAVGTAIAAATAYVTAGVLGRIAARRLKGIESSILRYQPDLATASRHGAA